MHHSLAQTLRILGRRILYRIPSVTKLPWGDRWIARNDVMDELLRSGEGFESAEQKFLLKFLRKGMIVFDIGAHHGLYTLLCARMVGSEGKVVAFEPSPRERERLEANIRLNGYRHVVIEPVALSASKGSGVLHVCLGRETGCNSLRPPSVDEATETVHVPLSSIDDYVSSENFPAVDFIKLDVEGAELDVLSGAGAFLHRTRRPVFLVELADIRTLPWGYRSNQIFDLLFSSGFHWFSVTPDGFLREAGRKDTFHENLVAVPNEMLSSMSSMRKG